MRRPGLALVAALALSGASAASAAAAEQPPARVSIAFASYEPAAIDVLAGDTVQWTNDSVRDHTVTAEDETWSSDRLLVGEGFSFRFESPGAFRYYCRVHPFMRGEVDAHTLLLKVPPGAATPGRPFPLAGRAALASGTPVAIEGDAGEGFRPVAATMVESDGGFAVDVVPSTTTTYRAVAAGETSPPVQLLVLDRSVAATAARRGRRVVVSAVVAPASPGATVVLQLHLRRRFGWWPVRTTRLDRRSRARIVLRLSRSYRARVLLTLPDGATQLASSGTLRIGPRR